MLKKHMFMQWNVFINMMYIIQIVTIEELRLCNYSDTMFFRKKTGIQLLKQ